jgi:hypothetical protein
MELFGAQDLNSLDFVVGLDEKRSLLKEGGRTRRTAGLHFGCCWLHKET